MVKIEYEDLIGIPFVDGGRNESGLDCWGLAKEMYRRQGINVKDYQISAMDTANIADELKKNEPDWRKLKEEKTGCLVVMRLAGSEWANHVGIMLEYGKFIHAYRDTGVCIDRLQRWKSHIVGFYEPRAAS